MNLREKVEDFLRKNPHPKSWRDSLKGYLPGKEDPRDGAPLVVIKDVGTDVSRILSVLKTNEVCREDLCDKYGLAQPNGTSVEWGDLVPQILDKVLPTVIEGALRNCKLLGVPYSLSIEYHAPAEIPAGDTKETFVGAPN